MTPVQKLKGDEVPSCIYRESERRNTFRYLNKAKPRYFKAGSEENVLVRKGG